MVRLQALLDSWKAIRQDTAQAWLDMPPADAGFKPVDGLMTYRELAGHIINGSRGMARMLMAGELDFSAPGFRERMREHYADYANLNRDELAERLGLTLEEDALKLAALDSDFYSRMMTRFDGTAVTRLEMLQYAKEHEITHRAQMFMYLRLKGIVPPTTRRRLAQNK